MSVGLVMAGLGAAGLAMQGVTSILNYQNQQSNLSYQKNLQQQIFNREDTSIQRRIADLKAAGLSPVLAAGQGASAGAVVRTDAPQYEGNPLQDAMQLMQMQQNIEQTQAQKKYLDMQAQGRSIENAIAAKDLESYIQYGTNPRNTTGLVRDLQQVLKMLGGNTVQAIQRDLQSKVDPSGKRGEAIRQTERGQSKAKYFMSGFGALGIDPKKLKGGK